MTSSVVPIRADVTIPDHITRVDISKMTDAQLDEMLNVIRTRRMVAFVVYEQTVSDREQAATEKALVALDKELDMIIKALNTVDKAFEKLETRINKLRGLRIQAGLNVV